MRPLNKNIYTENLLNSLIFDFYYSKNGKNIFKFSYFLRKYLIKI